MNTKIAFKIEFPYFWCKNRPTLQSETWSCWLCHVQSADCTGVRSGSQWMEVAPCRSQRGTLYVTPSLYFIIYLNIFLYKHGITQAEVTMGMRTTTTWCCSFWSFVICWTFSLDINRLVHQQTYSKKKQNDTHFLFVDHSILVPEQCTITFQCEEAR